jgi:hypothetical protein
MLCMWILPDIEEMAVKSVRILKECSDKFVFFELLDQQFDNAIDGVRCRPRVYGIGRAAPDEFAIPLGRGVKVCLDLRLAIGA